MSIVGHTEQLAQLEQDIVTNNIAHAYLFSGPRHIGKLTIAKWFGKKILSIGQSVEEARYTEKQCDRLIHPDFLLLDMLWVQKLSEDWDTIARFSNVPQQHRAKPKPKTTDTISIEDIRAIQERLPDTAIGEFRICIIRSAERMQEAAASALLKMLEEPLPGRIFILTTESIGSLLPTVESRVRRLHFGRVCAKNMLPLVDGMTEDEQRFLLYLAQGAPGVLTCYRENPDALRDARMLHERARSFWKTVSCQERMKLLDILAERSSISNEFLISIGLALRETRPPFFVRAAKAYSKLVFGLQSNTNRPLLLQQFALGVSQELQ
ncbi:hypothetical protein HYZ98_03965 [Candidatus Peregrinibacteria bacterium]|nr:hypothetical protein [Candidatus Peregrinibacteria bacterium]